MYGSVESSYFFYLKKYTILSKLSVSERFNKYFFNLLF